MFNALQRRLNVYKSGDYLANGGEVFHSSPAL